jgi:uncharacterized protein
MDDQGRQLAGHWALVTGASSGMGVDFARQLAARGANLVLVARRRERLVEVADELIESAGVRAEVIAMDLAVAGAADRLRRRTAALGIDVDVLVNNAGFGIHGDFLDMPWEGTERLIRLDMITLTELTRLYAEGMVARGRGWILQVASISAYQPVPSYAAYAAAKSYVLSFGEALGHELRGTGVCCTVVSPGVTATEFMERAGHRLTSFDRLALMESPVVARVGIRALLAGRGSIVPGLANAFNAWVMRFVPRRWAIAIVALTMRLGTR